MIFDKNSRSLKCTVLLNSRLRIFYFLHFLVVSKLHFFGETGLTNRSHKIGKVSRMKTSIQLQYSHWKYDNMYEVPMDKLSLQIHGPEWSFCQAWCLLLQFVSYSPIGKFMMDYLEFCTPLVPLYLMVGGQGLKVRRLVVNAPHRYYTNALYYGFSNGYNCSPAHSLLNMFSESRLLLWKYKIQFMAPKNRLIHAIGQ